ncbi:NUDIX hydrolase [Falsibacillus albus]|uniref:NUDIX hydrolase n=1 Tax=Falsibacillus albus TaxID=2478915 RepID=A0A3L7JQ20_9BACI|nr:NUDIX hydrolase [Falsibacillus albus]RLQ92424.1 NUDIX hydrolase [Falsibacillus albus]
MLKWEGSTAVCLNVHGEVLMVLQGKPEESKTWSVPTGGRDTGESFEACCVREVEEETGYKVDIVDKIKIKTGTYEELQVTYEAHYFAVKVVGGERKIQDPDQLIYDIAWKSINDLVELELTFPEDRCFLIDFIKNISA